jgi:hypothetical protein
MGIQLNTLASTWAAPDDDLLAKSISKKLAYDMTDEQLNGVINAKQRNISRREYPIMKHQ